VDLPTIEIAALAVSLLALGSQVRSSLLGRALTIHAFNEEGAQLTIRQRHDTYQGQTDYEFNITNHGRMPATIAKIGAMAIDDEGIYTNLTLELPDFYPYVVDSYDNVALSIPYESLFELRAMLPESEVKVFVLTTHSYDYGPNVPF
jgi:hypothetical protein